MTPLTEDEARVQLYRLSRTGLDCVLNSSAVGHNLPIPFVYAICSKETNCTNELGDYYSDEYHGIGIMQIDIHSWPMARKMRDDGSWAKHPEVLIDLGCMILEANMGIANQHFGTLSLEDRLELAAIGYNAGMGRATRWREANRDPDQLTTGHDYGQDVMARMKVFTELLLGDSIVTMARRRS